MGAKSVFLKSVGAAAPTAPMLTRPLQQLGVWDLEIPTQIKRSPTQMGGKLRS